MKYSTEGFLQLVQEILTGTQGLQQGYKDRADGYICQVLPSSISPASTTTYTPGTRLLLLQFDEISEDSAVCVCVCVQRALEWV